MNNKIKVTVLAYRQLQIMREKPSNFLLISAIDDLLSAHEPDSKMSSNGD